MATSLRLNKFLAQCAGISRREADRLIAAGRVRVNGEIQNQLGVSLDPEQTELSLDGQSLTGSQQLSYVLMNKPENYLVTRRDPQGRPTIYALLPEKWHHLYSVGRLDGNSCGLLLLTNDGDLTQRLLHPRFKVSKRYRVRVRERVTNEQIYTLRQGIELTEGRTQPADIRLLENLPERSWLEFRIREGKKRQIRRMCRAVGLHVLYLQRVALGPLKLAALPEGQARELSAQELADLLQLMQAPA